MRPIRVLGQGLWSPPYATVEAWRDHLEHPVDSPHHGSRPPCAMVSSRLGRATSMVTRILVEVASQATERAGIRADEVCTVFGSTHGEIHTALAQMEMMHDANGMLSPARFKNSVHNTANGIFSIAAGNRARSTALAGSSGELFAMCLMEAWTLLHTREATAVVLAIAEETLPLPLSELTAESELADSAADAFGVGLLLAADTDAGLSAHPRLRNLRREHAHLPKSSFATESRCSGSVAPALHLLRALAPESSSARESIPNSLVVSQPVGSSGPARADESQARQWVVDLDLVGSVRAVGSRSERNPDHRG